jgi:hypothetical protein
MTLTEPTRCPYEPGFDLHLTKPVAPEFLRDVMAALPAPHAKPGYAAVKRAAPVSMKKA